MAQDEDDTHDRLHQLTDLAPASQALGETRQRQVEGGLRAAQVVLDQRVFVLAEFLTDRGHAVLTLTETAAALAPACRSATSRTSVDHRPRVLTRQG